MAILFVLKKTGKQIVKPDEKNSQVELKLSSATTKIVVGEPFKFSLFFKSKTKKIASFDAVISYDPEIVRVDLISTSSVFPLYTRKLIEDYKNRFIISGVQTDLKQELKTTEGELAEITVTPLKSGKAKFDFLVEGRKYTNLSSQDASEISFSTKSFEVLIVD